MLALDVTVIRNQSTAVVPVGAIINVKICTFDKISLNRNNIARTLSRKFNQILFYSHPYCFFILSFALGVGRAQHWAGAEGEGQDEAIPVLSRK